MKAGVIKQKWTPQEEAALRAGVEKYGPGKWRAIQKDEKFGPCLASRSNVDLKDKWRNMSVSANGLGSRDKAARVLASKMKQVAAAQAPTVLGPGSELKAASTLSLVNTTKDKKLLGSRFESMVLEAVLSLKCPSGCNKKQIASYLEDHYSVPLNFRRMLMQKLKFLTQQGKLIKMRRNYIMSYGNDFQYEKAEKFRPRRQDIEAKTQILDCWQESEDGQGKMTAAEAAMLAAQAVAEAEAAAIAAEEAARVAEEAAVAAEVAEAEWEAAEAAAEVAAALATESPRQAVRILSASREGLTVSG